MKRYLLFSLLMSLFVPLAAFCQEPPEGPDQPGKMPAPQVRRRPVPPVPSERQAEVNFQRKMRDLQLQDRQIALERKRIANEHLRNPARRWAAKLLPLIVVCAIVHILTAVWVYQDIRKRNTGSGIWIAVALLTGLPGTLVYAVVRLGDIPPAQK